MDKLNILYTCDNSYLDLTSISIASVIENNKENDICFFLATEYDNDEKLEIIKKHYEDNKRIEFKYLDCKKHDALLEKKHLDKWGSNSYYVYWKMFAYDYLDVENVWYLDSDVICMREIDYPKIDKTIGAVLDSAHCDFNKLAHIDKDYYLYNTGALFVNVRKWKENRCSDKVINYIKNIRYKPLLCDQDILSISIQEEIEPINPRYNYLVGYDYYGVRNSFEMYSLNHKPFYQIEEIEEAKKDIIFYHCLGGVFGRPWERGNFSPIKDEFEKYRLFSAFPNYFRERNNSALFRIEHVLELLPTRVYNKLHNIAMKAYLRKIAKRAEI